MAWSDRQKKMSVNQKVVVCNKCGLGYLTNCRLPLVVPIPNIFAISWGAQGPSLKII